MAWKDVCVRGKPAGGKVRQDDVNKGDPPSQHNAGGPSPGILIFIDEVVRIPPPWQWPQKPSDFPSASCRVDTYPGKGKSDVHFEGRAVDVFLDYTDSDGKRWRLAFRLVRRQLQDLSDPGGYLRRPAMVQRDQARRRLCSGREGSLRPRSRRIERRRRGHGTTSLDVASRLLSSIAGKRAAARLLRPPSLENRFTNPPPLVQ